MILISSLSHWETTMAGRRHMSSAGAALLLLLQILLWTARPGRCSSGDPSPSPEEYDDNGGFEYASTTSSSCRARVASLREFGGVGDGATSNTAAFRSAVAHLSGTAGGGLLYVPAGRWLTGPFNLTSYFTLFLHRNAVILATQEINEWALVDPLPSYGRGRDKPGGRYTSFITGTNLTDVVITGDNGTIDGQGGIWWQKFHRNQLKYTRGYLIELMYSDRILVSNLTLLNSPSWNLHPVYSSNIIVSHLTILAPVHSPNTDGINPDSCTNVRIEDCYVFSGDDCVAIKSGWDEYGIAFGMPSQGIAVRRLSCVSPTSAAIAIGSEMSGGVGDVRVEDVDAVGTESGVRIKTAPGRGGYVRGVYVRRLVMRDVVKWVFWITGNYTSHPDARFDPGAIPNIRGISFGDVAAEGGAMAGRLEGIPGEPPFSGICMSNVTVSGVRRRKRPWRCSDVDGVAGGVSPKPCPELRDLGERFAPCPFPDDDPLPIDGVDVKLCSSAAPAVDL